MNKNVSHQRTLDERNAYAFALKFLGIMALFSVLGFAFLVGIFSMHTYFVEVSGTIMTRWDYVDFLGQRNSLVCRLKMMDGRVVTVNSALYYQTKDGDLIDKKPNTFVFHINNRPFDSFESEFPILFLISVFFGGVAALKTFMG